jgi:hypothetical protein
VQVRGWADWFTKYTLAEALHIRAEEVQRWIALGWLKCRVVQTGKLQREIIEAGDFSEMRKLLNRKIIEQDKKCAICHQKFTDYNDVVPTIRIPRVWEERGGTTIRTISELRTGGAISEKGSTRDELVGS